jgi:putative flippase GtrA
LAILFLFVFPFIITKETYVIGSLATLQGEKIITAASPALARVLSSIVNFILNQKYVFHSKEKTSSAAIKYFLLAAVVMVLNSILIVFFEEIFDNFTLAYILSQIITVALNYIVQKKLIFKAKDM